MTATVDYLGDFDCDTAAQRIARLDLAARAQEERDAFWTKSPAEMWALPQPLTSSSAAHEYPVESLPSTIRAAVDEVREFVQAPLPLVASAAISALSLAIQAHVDVKRAERLVGPSGLFLLSIADSGERKSTCDGYFTRAIRDYEREQEEASRELLADNQAAIAAWESRYAGVKERIKADAKSRKDTIALESDLRDLERAKPIAPRVPRLIFGDATPEALAHSLAMKWPSGGVVSAEAGIVFGSHGMASDSVMRNLAVLNTLWDGAPLKIDRRTSDSYAVNSARLTVALQVQEATIRSFFERTGTLARGTGFLARFLIAWPESTQGSRLFREGSEHWPNMAVFNNRITEILRQSAPLDDRGNLAPLMLDFSPEAKALWVQYHDQIEAQLATGGELHDVRDVASKSADNAARLAALFHVFEGNAGSISADAFENASCIAAWHLSEAKRFFGGLVQSEDEIDASRLDAWLVEECRAKDVSFVSKRDAQRFGPLRKQYPLAAALRVLEDLDRLRIVNEGKKILIAVNPALLKGGAK